MSANSFGNVFVKPNSGHADIVSEGGIFHEVYTGPGVPQPRCDTAGCFFCCMNMLGNFRFETRRAVYQVEVYVNQGGRENCTRNVTSRCPLLVSVRFDSGT